MHSKILLGQKNSFEIFLFFFFCHYSVEITKLSANKYDHPALNVSILKIGYVELKNVRENEGDLYNVIYKKKKNVMIYSQNYYDVMF